jgi:hypothetical protein
MEPGTDQDLTAAFEAAENRFREAVESLLSAQRSAVQKALESVNGENMTSSTTVLLPPIRPRSMERNIIPGQEIMDFRITQSLAPVESNTTSNVPTKRSSVLSMFGSRRPSATGETGNASPRDALSMGDAVLRDSAERERTGPSVTFKRRSTGQESMLSNHGSDFNSVIQQGSFFNLRNTLRMYEDHNAPRGSQDPLARASLLSNMPVEHEDAGASDERSCATDVAGFLAGREITHAWLDPSFKEVTKQTNFETRNRVQEFLLPVTQSECWGFFSMVLVLSMCFSLGMDVHCEMKAMFADYMVEDDDEKKIERRLSQTGNVHSHLHMDPRVCWAAAPWGPWTWINLIFFTIEVALRALAEQRDFFCGPHRRWNIFDLILLGINAVDFTPFAHRIMDVVRVLRMLRMLRLFEIFPDLRTMMYSLCACGPTLGWAFFLLLVCMTMVAMYLDEVSLYYMKPSEGHQTKWLSDQDIRTLKENWNGMYLSIMSLVYSITGGADWHELAEPFFNMGKMGAVHGLLFTMFILLTVLGLLNILVGVFVQKSDDLSRFSRDTALANARQRLKANSTDMEELFNEFDRSSHKYLSREEIIEGLKRPRIQAYFHHLNIDIVQPDLMAQFFDVNNEGVVDKKEFVKGCQRLTGAAKPAEIAILLGYSRSIDQRLSHLLMMCESGLLGGGDTPQCGTPNHTGPHRVARTPSD